MWSTGEGNGKPLQYSCLENPMNSMQRQKGHWKMSSPGQLVPNMLLEVSGEITLERMKRWSQSKNNTQLWMWLVIEVKSNAAKSNIAQEPGMSGPWIKANWKRSNRRWQAWTATILGIRELKWTGMDEFNWDDIYIYYYGQGSLRTNGVAFIVNQRVWNAVLGCSLKNDRMISVGFQGKPFHITVIQVYTLTSNVKEAEVEQFYEDLQDLLELKPKKDVLFIIGFPDSSVGKESACNAGDPGSIPGSGRSAGERIGYPLQYSWASLGAQLVKNTPAIWETWIWSLGWEDPLEKGKAIHSSILAWRIPWSV